ncbi:type IV secretory system conjugative DNA transfer family protein [Cognatilysobacter terrigena]|uniref:type IV secretory system conjugative DNA transfer family protein n=1 Tax=Cognatilysobacter terrigena TaxID=2488749 RepID=UPI0010615FD3|nr:type IV secretory system conjugative DNA transfer family protein [Lysobacter terrigena]
MSRRTLAALVGFALVPVVGLWLSSHVNAMVLGLHGALPHWYVYVDYIRTLDLPQVQPYAAKIRAAGWVGFGAPTLAYIGALALVMRQPAKSLHGDARFARGGDLAKNRLFEDGPTSLVIGRYDGRLVRLPGQQFAILAAPTRSGKGVGIVIPNLLEYQDSVVVLDIKQENFDLTSGWRASQGHEVFLFNPFAEDRRSHRWNPLGYVSDDPAFRVSDVMAIAAMLYPDGADEQKFWVSQGRNAFLAFALYLFDKYDHERTCGFPGATVPTLGAVYRLSSGTGENLRAYLGSLSQQRFLSEPARMAFATLLSQADETFASILGTFKEPLNPWVNPVLDAATSANDFLLTDLRKKRMTVYIGVQPNKLAESRLILNLFFSQLINLNTRELPQNNPALKHQCLLLMDEFTSIGKVDIIATAVAYMAGYNLRLLPIIQSMAQLDATYGRETARTLVTNHALQILYAPREQQDANDYSEMLGYTTVRRQNVTRGRDVSRSESVERRALMLPQELKALGPDREVVMYEGIPHPVLCEKIRYYTDKRYTARLLPKVAVPTLSIMTSRAVDAREAVSLP